VKKKLNLLIFQGVANRQIKLFNEINVKNDAGLIKFLRGKGDLRNLTN